MKIVIAGAGSVGKYLLERLVAEDHAIVVIDQDEQVLETLSSAFDIQTLQGNASVLANLERADVQGAEIFIAATDSDEANLIACMLADSLNPAVRKIARIRELITDASGLSDRIAEFFDHFINPDSEAVGFLLRLFQVPGAVEVMEFGGGRVWVVGVVVRAEASLVGRRLKQLSLPDVVIVAIQRDGQVIIPGGQDLIQAGDELYVAARANEFDSFFNLLGRERHPTRHVMIYGGGNIGRGLAKELSGGDVKIKLIETDAARCSALASELSNVLVLCGDGTDQELLREEGVADVDLFVGATDDEETNILAALLAKRLGAKMSAVIITKSSYLNLIPELGIDIVVSPHIAAASSILKFVRSGSISSIFSTRDDRAEVLEVFAEEGSPIVGIPLKELKLPQGVIVAAVHDEETASIARGDTVITPGSKVVFFASRKGLPKLQELVNEA